MRHSPKLLLSAVGMFISFSDDYRRIVKMPLRIHWTVFCSRRLCYLSILCSLLAYSGALSFSLVRRILDPSCFDEPYFEIQWFTCIICFPGEFGHLTRVLCRYELGERVSKWRCEALHLVMAIARFVIFGWVGIVHLDVSGILAVSWVLGPF